MLVWRTFNSPLSWSLGVPDSPAKTQQALFLSCKTLRMLNDDRELARSFSKQILNRKESLNCICPDAVRSFDNHIVQRQIFSWLQCRQFRGLVKEHSEIFVLLEALDKQTHCIRSSLYPAPSNSFFNIFRMQNSIYTAAFAFAESSSSEAHLRLPLSPSQTARSHSKLWRIFLFTYGTAHSLYWHKKPAWIADCLWLA